MRPKLKEKTSCEIYVGVSGELEHLKIETRLRDERVESMMMFFYYYYYYEEIKRELKRTVSHYTDTHVYVFFLFFFFFSFLDVFCGHRHVCSKIKGRVYVGICWWQGVDLCDDHALRFVLFIGCAHHEARRAPLAFVKQHIW